MLAMLGMFMLYSYVHFAIIQHKKSYKERNGYEKFITWFAIVTLIFLLLSVMGY